VCATAMRSRKRIRRQHPKTDDRDNCRHAEKRCRPLGRSGQVFPLDHCAADHGAGHGRADHDRPAEKPSRNSGLQLPQVARPDDPGAGRLAPDLAGIRSAPRRTGGSAALAGLRRACRACVAVCAVVCRAAGRMVVRFGLRAAPALLVRPFRGAAPEWTRCLAQGPRPRHTCRTVLAARHRRRRARSNGLISSIRQP